MVHIKNKENKIISILKISAADSIKVVTKIFIFKFVATNRRGLKILSNLKILKIEISMNETVYSKIHDINTNKSI